MFNWLVNNLGRLLGLVEKDTGCCFYPVEHYEEQVSENLWRGSRLNQELYDDLTRRGFTLVVSFCAEEKYGDKQ